ncbi:MAG: hypothetical protein K9G62_06245 [Alphaproteobacteria bacterium]|nr:hypothetical protein [Alphaproteobacteria bacterium]
MSMSDDDNAIIDIFNEKLNTVGARVVERAMDKIVKGRCDKTVMTLKAAGIKDFKAHIRRPKDIRDSFDVDLTHDADPKDTKESHNYIWNCTDNEKNYYKRNGFRIGINQDTDSSLGLSYSTAEIYNIEKAPSHKKWVEGEKQDFTNKTLEDLDDTLADCFNRLMTGPDKQKLKDYLIRSYKEEWVAVKDDDNLVKMLDDAPLVRRPFFRRLFGI